MNKVGPGQDKKRNSTFPVGHTGQPGSSWDWEEGCESVRVEVEM